jgi:hypothetical protein
MANDCDANPWVIDTAYALTNETVRIERIAWKNAAALNHTCKVVDAYGKTVYEDFASGSTYNNVEHIGRAVEGLTVQTLQSGKLYIYLAHSPTSF